MKKITLLFLLFTLTSFGQCFECAKNFGGWVDEYVMDLTKTTDGIVLTMKTSSHDSSIKKFDYNCNLIWEINFDIDFVRPYDATTDDQGNTYHLIFFDGPEGYQPTINGFTLSKGFNIYKLNPDGQIMWFKYLGFGSSQWMVKGIHYHQGNVFVVGNFVYESIIIDNQITLTGTIDYLTPHAFIAKYDTSGNLIDAKAFNSESAEFLTSEIDTSGNIYLTAAGYFKGYIKKISPQLQLLSTTILAQSNNEIIIRPTSLYFNPINNKLYLWTDFDYNITFMGNPLTAQGTSSIIAEFDTSVSLLNFYKLNTHTSLASGVSNTSIKHSGYMAGAGNDLYVLTSFYNYIAFPGQTIFSSNNATGYYNEDMVFFKIDLDTFTPTYIFKSSNGDPDNPYVTKDGAGPIFYNDNVFYLTGNFKSIPLIINGSTIGNNSGNNDSDVMLYKYALNETAASGEIAVINTCINDVTSFNIEGNFVSVAWNFGDPASSDNTAGTQQAQHQFANPGTYTVTAVVDCGNNSQTVVKDVIISTPPVIMQPATLYACETVPGSGISSNFDTSNLIQEILASQQNMQVKYFKANGDPLPSPLPNPYTNIVPNSETITIRVAAENNPTCYSETALQLTVLPIPVANSLPDIYACEDVVSTGVSSQFNTGTVNQTLLGSQTGMEISYFDEAGNLLSFPLPNPMSNSIADSETITARVTNPVNGCYKETTFKLITNPLPQLNNNVIVYGCDDNNDGISNSFTTSSLNTQLINGNAAGISLSYYNDSGDFLFNDFPSNYTNSQPYEQIIIARATNNQTNCYSEISFTLKTVNQPPVNTLPVLFACNEGNGIGEFDTSAIEGLLVTDLSSVVIKYYDSAGIQLPSPLPNPLTAHDNENITIKVENASNPLCYTETSLSLRVVEPQTANMEDEYYYCIKDYFHTINAPSGFDNYEWKDDRGNILSANRSVLIYRPGNYSLTVYKLINGILCNSTRNIEVIGYEEPVITDVITIDNSDNNSLEIIAVGNGNYSYSLDGINYQEANIFENIPGGIYTVYVKDMLGCGMDKETVSIISYPKFFTPNGDGTNDYWYIKGLYNLPGSVTNIFDRYGKSIASLGYNSSGWDGTYNGTPMPATDYWFEAVLPNGRTIKGHFSLSR